MQNQLLKELYEQVAHLAPDAHPQVSLRPSDRPPGFRAKQFANDRPSIGKRMFRALVRFCIAVLIGVSATLAWQLHGVEAEKIVGPWLTSLRGFLPISGFAKNISYPQSAPTVQISAPAEVMSSEITQQLKIMANDLADAQRSLGQLTEIARDVGEALRNLEQLTARQEQIAQSIATLQKFEQDVRQRLASAPQSRLVPLPPRKPPPTAESSAVQASSVPAPLPSTQQSPPSR
jgi:hypothetical protein